MRRLFFLILVLLLNIEVYSRNYADIRFSIYSPKALALGNSYTSAAGGFESFEYNPAGLVKEDEWTLFNFNSVLISNIFDLNRDLIDTYNETRGESQDFLGPREIVYLLKDENIRSLVTALLKQVSVPDDGTYANGLGFAPVFYTGVIKNGLGLGLILSLDTEFFGDNIPSTTLNNVLTVGTMVGYARKLKLQYFDLDVGGSIRPMYRLKADTKLSPLLTLVEGDSENLSGEDLLRELNYLTGLGIGWDLGLKAYYRDLILGISFMDMLGTDFIYSNNSYQNIVNGDFLGGVETKDKYTVPMSIRLGLLYNPVFGDFNNIINPTISLDYRLLLVEKDFFNDYVHQDSFWINLSTGLDLELFRVVHLRGGINQGYITLGAGFSLNAVEVNGVIYSKELGRRVGYRQQMGAGIEFAFRL